MSVEKCQPKTADAFENCQAKGEMMKTLDEVINELECYPVSPSTLPCNVSIVAVDDLNDALHYLEEYQDMIKKLENCQKENQRLKKRVEKLESDAAWDADYRRGQVQGMW